MPETSLTSPDLRIIITGVPRSGKTTLATQQQQEWLKQTGQMVTLHSSDDLQGPKVKPIAWSDQSRLAASWLDEPGPWICEGITMVRAVRKWMAENPIDHNVTDLAPCDLLIFIDRTSHSALKPGQLSLAKGCKTVYNQIHEELLTRGVETRTYGPNG